MIFSRQPKWINPIYRRGGGHISLKVGERMDIGGVSAPVILAMVGLNFVRTAPTVGGDVLHKGKTG
jgi:hypothetical protein